MSLHLSPVQKEAVEFVGSPTIVAAGAGSGKTRTLTAKVAHLIKNLGYDPARILAITFTNKAADEMKVRLEQITGLKRSEFPWVRTFHSACLRIIKEHLEEAGYKDPLAICSEYHREKHLKAVLLAANLEPKKFLGPVGFMISMAKNSGAPYVHLKLNPVPALHPTMVKGLYDAYCKRLKDANTVDFDDLLLVARNLLRDNESIRDAYRDLFQFVLVDEYQDTNDLQEELTRLVLKGGNLFVVGDDFQSIYGFRGSNIENFLSFGDRFPGAKVIKLEENYRSASEIVELAEELIRHNKQMPKKCFSRKTGGKIQVRGLNDEHHEAKWVAQQILLYRRMGLPFSKMAILYRGNALSLAFEQELRALNIPYKLKGDKGFFERKEILDVNCYLQSAMNPLDDVSFERIMNAPKRGVGGAAFEKIMKLKQPGMTLQEACAVAIRTGVLPPKVALELDKLLKFLASIREDRPEIAIHRVLIEAGYEAHMEGYCKGRKNREFQNRMENLQSLLFVASQKESLAHYLEEVTLDGPTELDNKDGKEDEERDAKRGVTLSTVHGAKGLEWDVVFVVGMEENLFPHWRAMEEVGGEEEERRLAYVAFTRAIRFLNLSYARKRQNRQTTASLFFDDAGLEF